MSNLSNHTERVEKINDAHASGDISSEQRDELLGMENNTASYIKLRYAALAILGFTVALFFLLS